MKIIKRDAPPLDLSPAESMPVREARPEDNEALIALTNASPIRIGFGLMNIERGNDYFALNRARGDVHVFVAEQEGEIVGASAVTLREAVVGGAVKKVFYGGDLKVNPKVRKRKLGTKLSIAVFDRARELKADFMIGIVSQRNLPSMNLITSHYGWEPARICGRVITYSLRLQRRLKVERRYESGPPRPEEIPDLVKLHNEHYKHFNFHPRFTPESFTDMLERTPGYSLDDFLVARVDGKPVAMAGLWDIAQCKQVVIKSYRRPIAVGIRILKAVLSILRIKFWIPEAGKPWEIGYLRHYAAHRDHLPALSQLVREHCQQSHDQHRFRYLSVTFHHKDRTRLVVRRIPRHQARNLFGYCPIHDPERMDALVDDDAPYFEDLALA
ncbi:GNAT family N-acetyltransferase [Thermodesulfobacteriota bacterium]